VALIPDTVPVNVGDANGANRFNADCVAVLMGLLESVVLLTFPRPTMVALIPDTVPVNVGDAKGAFKFKAVCVAVLIGLVKSVVLLTFASPTIEAVMPDTIPVNVGDAKGAIALEDPKFAAINVSICSFEYVSVKFVMLAISIYYYDS
jgi:hypothetical protein